SRAAGRRALYAGRVAAVPAARWAAGPQGRRERPGGEALVHVGSRPADGAPHARTLLEHGGAHGGARARRLRRAPPSHGRSAALSPRAVRLRGSSVTAAPLLTAHGLTAGYG